MFKRLAKLTSATKKNLKQTIDELYPHHTTALKKSGLIPKKLPTLKEILEESESSGSKEIKTKKENDVKFFLGGYSFVWV